MEVDDEYLLNIADYLLSNNQDSVLLGIEINKHQNKDIQDKIIQRVFDKLYSEIELNRAKNALISVSVFRIKIGIFNVFVLGNKTTIAYGIPQLPDGQKRTVTRENIMHVFWLYSHGL